MTFIPTTIATTAGATAASAAAARRRRQEEMEEEQLTGYHKEDLEGWEFKIVRASSRKFKDPDVVRQLCADEASAGWEMLEKFDDTRIRFKRGVEHRAHDAYLDGDPYRTQLGISTSRREIVISAAVVVIVGVLLLTAMLVFGLR